MDSIFFLPEIAITIGSHLERDDLRNCVLVHSSWKTNFAPCLWRTLKHTVYPLHGIGHTNDIINIPAIIANSHYIRTIRSNSAKLIPTALTHCTNLRHLHIPGHTTPALSKMDFIKEILIPGIKRNQSLETLVYKNLPISRWKADGSQSLFKELLQPLRVLTHLNLSFDTGIYRETFIYLARFARQLQQLKIPSISICHRTDEEEQGEADTPELEQTQLRHLELGSFDFLEEHLLFIPLLKASPELRGLGLPSFQHENTQLVTQVIRDNCPKLTNINLERTHFCLNDDDVAEIIGVCRRSGLRSIQFNRGLRPNSIAALCSYTTTLGSVKIPAYGPGSVQAALHLLRSCPTLRVLKMLTEELNGRDIGIFSAKDLLEDPWVCMELEIFSIPIVDVFNRTADEHIREDIDVGHVVHYDYHQQFYTQLSKLTKLQELSVGISRNCLKSTKTSVLFSLESGLAILSELKNMRLLDVSSTMARIGRKELRWMYDHWPQLEFIKNENVGNCNPWERSFSEDGDDTPLTEELLTLLRYDPDPLADWIYD